MNLRESFQLSLPSSQTYKRIRSYRVLLEWWKPTHGAYTPPTKEGKNNSHRQTNARTVYIIKHINFFDGSGIKTDPF